MAVVQSCVMLDNKFSVFHSIFFFFLIPTIQNIASIHAVHCVGIQERQFIEDMSFGVDIKL